MFSVEQTPPSNGENGDGRKRKTQDQQQPTSANDNDDLIDQPINILSRRYRLTRTSYKYIEVCITVRRPSSRVNIILGDTNNRVVLITPETWKELVDQRKKILYHLRHGNGDANTEMRVGDLVLRFGRINHLPVVRIGESTAGATRLVLSLNTVLVMYGLDHCVSRIVSALNAIVGSVDEKHRRFSDFASTVPRNEDVSEAIRDAEFYNRNDIVDCELASLCFF